MFAEAAIPAGLLAGGGGGSGASRDSGHNWAIGPFKLRLPLPASSSWGAGGGGGTATGQRAALDAVDALRNLVGGVLAPTSGRGGVASTSGGRPPAIALRGRGGSRAAAAASSVRLEYTDETPYLVGKRSISLRPRHMLPLSGAEPLYDDRDTRWWTIDESAPHGSYSWALQDYQAERDEVAVPGDAWRADLPSDTELPPVLTCRDLVKQVLVDQHGRGDTVTPAFADRRCPPGSYKVMAFTAPVPPDDEAVNYCDHHFYVQHKDVAITLQAGDTLSGVASFFRVPVEALYDANPGLEASPPDAPLPRERRVVVRGANVWSHKPTEWLPPRLHDGAGRAIFNPMRAVPGYSDDEGDLQELPGQYCCSFCVVRGAAKTGPQARAGADEQA